MKKTKKGFTLVELLVVIAIIGILAAIGITALSTARLKARDAKRVADLKQIQGALELYFNDKGSYPPGTALALGALNDCSDEACDTISSDNGISNTAAGTVYMGLIPKDPNATTAECTSTSTGVCHYSYSALKGDDSPCGAGEVCTKYRIWAYLEGGSGGLGAGVICASQNGIANTTCP